MHGYWNSKYMVENILHGLHWIIEYAVKFTIIVATRKHD